MRKYIFFSIIISAVLILSGCDGYHSNNSPRGTVTNKPNILTTVTTVETTRADTYSQYMSSLREAGADNGYSHDPIPPQRNNGVAPDTAVSVPIAETSVSETEPVPRDTAMTKINVIVVTTVPPRTEETEETTETAVCTPPETENVTSAPDFPDFSLDDIPSVPSDAVKADTAVTNP